MGILILPILGCLIGFFSSYIIEPTWINFIFGATLIGLLGGIFLGWIYNVKVLNNIRLIALISMGMVIGMFLGVAIGGMLAPVLAAPFPESWFKTHFFSS